MHGGILFNIQRYSLHDGPGIRTTVFLKGCPLRCIWCCNPESQRSAPEIGSYPGQCIQCGACVGTCPLSAIVVREHGSTVDRARCDRCGLCADACLTGGLRRIGRRASVGEVVDEVEKDRAYYATSGGGVTLSGGEPTMQPEFASDLLAALKERGLHTAMETCGHSSWDVMASLLPNLDLILYDLKQINSGRHRQLTGFPNDLILANARQVAESGVSMIVRVPVIPGCNDDRDSISGLVSFVAGLPGGREIHFLPYHRLGVGKVAAIGGGPAFDSPLIPTAESLGWAMALASEAGLAAQIGG